MSLEAQLEIRELNKRITELEADIAEQDERISIYLSQSTDRKVLYIADCKKRIAELEAENAIMVKAIDNYAALPHHLAGIARDVINSIHKLRAEGGGE